jgi:hypothetical protein
MLQVNWQGQRLDVSRLVFKCEQKNLYDTALARIAAHLHLEVADDRTEPWPGDFWIGCYPRAGWTSAEPERIGWAITLEVPLAVAVLKHAAIETERLTEDAVPDMTVRAAPFSASDSQQATKRHRRT